MILIPRPVAFYIVAIIFTLIISCNNKSEKLIELRKDTRIVLIGNNLGSRMMDYGLFDTEVQSRFADSTIFIRNMCNPGNTAGFRPHPSRYSPWAFEGAEKFNPDYNISTGSEGHFPTEDEWLETLKADVIIGFFGFNESFNGPAGLENFKQELKGFIEHTKAYDYNKGKGSTLVLVSPIAFEDLSGKYDLPDGKEINANIKLYTEAMDSIAKEMEVPFVDVFSASNKWFKNADKFLTIDGSQLNELGYTKFSEYLVTKLFGEGNPVSSDIKGKIKEAVLEKDWIWKNDFKIPNGVHAYGRRYNPFGPENYPYEVKKLRQMGEIRDTAIWEIAKGNTFDLAKKDKKTIILPEVKTNYKIENGENSRYLYAEEALAKFHMAPGYKIDLFASEKEFPDLANPVQTTFDAKGRLWVATMPSYPHWRVGDGRPNDKIIILEDTNNDGKADKQIVFADKLHLPIGFEFSPDGVYVSQGKDMILLKDTNGDDIADSREVILSGFDDHDTHHAHSVYTMDPSGAILMAEGVFLHSNIETSYGPIRATNGGFFRYIPQKKKLERISQVSIPNPWGIAIDNWGQAIYLETSGPDVRWMLPGSVKPRYGVATDKSFTLVDSTQRVRPTSGLEFISSRHFPDSVQGDYLLNNTIGFLGAKQHTFEDEGTGYKSKFRQDLFWSEDKNFRPVDLEFAPDGSLYIIDWHNILIGHMQHNARDPLRDHVHGRVYRITYPSKPLIAAAKVHGATVEQLLDNLKLPEYRTRYRTRSELRNRDQSEVVKKVKEWVKGLDKNDPNYFHHLTEAMWVTWGVNAIDNQLVNELMLSKDYKARSAAVRAVINNIDKISNHKELLEKAATDSHGRVKLELIVGASWMPNVYGLELLSKIDTSGLDKWNKPAFLTASAHLNNTSLKPKSKSIGFNVSLKGEELEQFKRGAVIFNKEGFCVTCHQADGKGLESSGFPPLNNTSWVIGNEERLIKLTLKGLLGPIVVNEKKYPGQVPMTPFGGMLNDQEIADVLTYVRNSFGNKGAAVSAKKVEQIRAAVKNKTGFYSPAELLKEHP